MSSRSSLLLPVLFLVGCAEGNDAPADAGTSDAALGGFVVGLVSADPEQGRAAYAWVQGKVYDGTMPEGLSWTVEHEAGGCRLLVPHVPFCAAPCGGTAACVAPGQCVPYPTALNLGRVRVAGVGAAAFEMEPVAGSYQPDAAVKLPYPPFSEGGVVRVTAAGGALGAFALEARAIAPLAFEQSPALVAGQPVPLTWTPPAQGGTRIEASLDISHHGGAKGRIECDVPDSGHLELSADQVTRLLALGVAGFPTIVLARVSTGTTAVRAGGITLRVVSAVERPVQIEGLRSCKDDSQCPPGKLCRSDLTCQP
jgi:hypothetical protein